MIDHQTVECLRRKYAMLQPELDERARRCWAATEALALGYGGASAVARACGIARNTITAGTRELSAPTRLGADLIRRPGAGRRPLAQTDPGLPAALVALAQPAARR